MAILPGSQGPQPAVILSGAKDLVARTRFQILRSAQNDAVQKALRNRRALRFAAKKSVEDLQAFARRVESARQ
jgi:hypothetical protein